MSLTHLFVNPRLGSWLFWECCESDEVWITWWSDNFIICYNQPSVSNSSVENEKISRAIDNWWSQLSIQRPNEVGTFWWKIVGISDEKWSQIICLKVKLWPARARWYEWKSSSYNTCKIPTFHYSRLKTQTNENGWLFDELKCFNHVHNFISIESV